MHKLLIALAGATALTAASAANAALTIGTAGSTNGTATTTLTSTGLEFDTSGAAAGPYSSFFQFTNGAFNLAVFSATASTVPLLGTTVSTLQLFTGGSVTGGVYSGGTLVSGGGTSGTGNSLTLNNVSLTPNANYTLQYTGSLANSGNISGNGAFGNTAVPEPATWGLMLLGFGGIGMAMRRRRRPVLAQIA